MSASSRARSSTSRCTTRWSSPTASSTWVPTRARCCGRPSRVLRPGGRFPVSDVVVQGQLPAQIRRSLEQWVGCVGGALDEASYRRLLAEAGFEQVGLEVTRVLGCTRGGRGGTPGQAAALAAVEATGGRLVGAFVRGTKPASTPWPQVAALVHRALAESIGTAPLPARRRRLGQHRADTQPDLKETGPCRRTHVASCSCTHNSARSQMAEGLRALGEECFEAFSAGTEATEVRPLAIRARAIWAWWVVCSSVM